MRCLALASLALVATTASAQDYTERWRDLAVGVGTEKLAWEQVEISPADDVTVAGRTSTSALVVRSYTKDGVDRWTTRDTTLEAGFTVSDMKLDGSGNAYVLTLEPTAGLGVSSYSGATGAFRWQRRFGFPVDANMKRSRLALAVRGNTTFLYVACTSANGQSLRLNSTTGSLLFSTAAGGESPDIDANGNLNLVAGLEFVKLNQSLNQVWRADTDFFFGAGLRTHPLDGQLVGCSVDSLTDFFFLALSIRNATTGSIIRKRSVIFPDSETSSGRGQVFVPRPNGGWITQNGGVVMGFDSGLKVDMGRKILPAEQFTVDSAGQVHVVTIGKFGVTNAARGTSFETTFASSQKVGDLAADSANRVVLVGSANDESFGAIVQIATAFAVGTDVFSEPYLDRLEIRAPGVLINDSNNTGGVVSLETAPTNGTLDLRADGSLVYSPNAGTNGNDQFRYRVTKNGVVRSATAFVKRVVPIELKTVPSSVIGGDPFDAVLTVGTSTFIDPFQVEVSSSNPLVTPVTITMDSGKISSSAKGFTQVVTSATASTLTATLVGKTVTATLPVLPGGLSDIVSNGAPLIRGQRGRFVLRLSGILTASRVFTISGGGFATQNVTVPAGSASAEFEIALPNSPTLEIRAEIFVSGRRLGIESNFQLAPAPQLASVRLTNSLLYAGVPNAFEVTLDSPSGFVATSVQLASSNANVTVPSSVSVPTSQTTASRSLAVSTAGANQTVTLTATLNGASQSVTTLIRPNLLDSFTTSTTIVRAGSSLKGTVQLTWIAPAGGQAVQISSSRPATVVVPSSVTVAVGLTSKSFTISTKGPLPATTLVTITARIGSVSKARTISVLP